MAVQNQYRMATTRRRSAASVPRAEHQVEVEVAGKNIQKEISYMLTGLASAGEAALLDTVDVCWRILSRWGPKSRTEFVRKLLNIVIEAEGDRRMKIISFWNRLIRENLFSSEILVDSITPVLETTDDVVLDVPYMCDYVVEIIGPLVLHSLLPMDLVNGIFEIAQRHERKYHEALQKWTTARTRLSAQDLDLHDMVHTSKQNDRYGRPPPGGGGGGDQRKGGYGRYPSNHNQPQVIKLTLTQDEFVPPPSNENAWKPGVKKEKVVASDEASQNEEIFATIRALLNKLTPNNYDKLSAKMMDVPFTTTSERLTGTVDLIFEKALEELNYAELYAKLCCNLITVETKDAEGKPVKVRTVLLQRAQRYFEKTDKEELEAAQAGDKPDADPLLLAERRAKAKRHYLGNIRFNSELFKIEMLTDKVILSCFHKLLPKKPDFSDADEEKLECLCKLLMTCAQRVKAPDDVQKVGMFFDMLKKMIDSKVTSSRIRFLMQDAIDLKNSNYVARKNVIPANVKPKTINQIHAEKRQEEQDIKQAVMDLPPMSRGQQLPIRGGMRGQRGRRLRRSELGRLKPKSIPGNSANMGRVELPDLMLTSTETESTPKKFSYSLGGGKGQSGGVVLGPAGQYWSGGSGSLRPGSSVSLLPENRSASSSREFSASRMDRREGPRKSLTLTPSCQVESSLLENTSLNTPSRTPSITPVATPVARLPVLEEVELDDENLEKASNHMIAEITKSEDGEIAEVTTEAVRNIRRWGLKSRTDFAKSVLKKFLEAKRLEHRIMTLWNGVAHENLLSSQVLMDSVGEIVEATDDIVVDVPNVYDHVMEFIGPSVLDSSLSVDMVNDVFKESPHHESRYHRAFQTWINVPDRLPSQKKEELLNKELVE